MLRAIRHHLKRKKSNHPFTVCCNKNSNVTLNKIRFGRTTKLDYLYILELKFLLFWTNAHNFYMNLETQLNSTYLSLFWGLKVFLSHLRSQASW